MTKPINMDILTFQKSCVDDKWYFRYPQYPGPHCDLEMVSGAESLLNQLADGMRIVQMKLSLEHDPLASMVLHKIEETQDEQGANYQWIDPHHTAHIIWLCGVMHHVFQGYPETLYVTPIALYDNLQKAKKHFFDQALSFHTHPQISQSEWALLEDTQAWIIWEALFLWKQEAQLSNIHWYYAQVPTLQFLSFRQLLDLPEDDRFRTIGLPELYLSRTRHYPKELTIAVQDQGLAIAQSFFQQYFEGQYPWVKVLPFSTIDWVEISPTPTAIFQEDIMLKAQQITQWSMDNVDLWRRLAQKKDRMGLQLIQQPLDPITKSHLLLLEKQLQQETTTKMRTLWWEIAQHFKKKSNNNHDFTK